MVNKTADTFDANYFGHLIRSHLDATLNLFPLRPRLYLWRIVEESRFRILHTRFKWDGSYDTRLF